MKHRWFLALSTPAVAIVLGVALVKPAGAGESSIFTKAGPNHLVCYKIKVKTDFRGTVVDLATQQFGDLTNCEVKKAKEFCVPANKTVKDLASGLEPSYFEGGGCPEDYVCMKIKCDKVDKQERQVLDQFGLRDMTLKKPFKLCVPAVKGCVETGRTFVEWCKEIADPADCNKSWQISYGTGLATSCYYGKASGETYGDPNALACRGCGPNNDEAGLCDNSCIDWKICGDRTFLPGHPGGIACKDVGDENACNTSWALGYSGPTSCFWDGACYGCGPWRAFDGQCTNECLTQCWGRIEGPSGPTMVY